MKPSRTRMNFLMILQVLLSYVLVVASADDLTVDTSSGRVRGMTAKSRDGRDYRQFLGIPYAKPPTGSLRFKSPVKPEHWNTVLNATKECSECLQQLMLTEATLTTVSGAEDCLCLNVFTPTTSSSAKLAVIVWIHGGGYLGSSSTTRLYGADLLMDRDVVLVTINYRVGTLGFLMTDDSAVPGNFGMKDQSFALRWVQENIAQFGGDAACVTLFGESAGATSVSLHQYSPLSKGLFHRAIQNSGSLMNPWGLERSEVLKGRSAATVALVGCSGTKGSALLQCLQAVPANSLVNTTHTFVIEGIDPLIVWAPAVEAVSTTDAFLTKDPKTMLEAATLPLLTGLNAAEGGLYSVPLLGLNADQKLALWNSKFDTVTPLTLEINNTLLDRPAVTRALRRFYFGSENQTITKNHLKEITQLYGDSWFTVGILEEAEKRSGPTFLYYYNYNQTFSLCPVLLLGAATPYPGACHYDDLPNFFPVIGYASKRNTSDPGYNLSVQMLDLWTNFAKSGNPSTNKIAWKFVSSSALEFLDITNSGITMKSNLLQERRSFWKSLYSLP